MCRRSGEVTKTNFEWIAIISVINIIVSGLILYKYHFSPAELSSHFADLVNIWLGKLWTILPESKPPSPRIIPL